MKTDIYTLCICYPTYNRGDLLVNQVKDILSSCSDTRFCIRVQDNCSTDGSYEELQRISDPRFVLCRNKENVGSINNAQTLLYGNSQAAYVLFLIDKDLIRVQYLSAFIDYLEQNRPWGGYLQLHHPQGNPPILYEAGFQGLLHMGYLSKHPSGFFWRSEWLTQEMDKPFFKQLPPKFDFWFDVLLAHCSAQHPTVIVGIPLVVEWWDCKNQSYIDKLSAHKTNYTSENLYCMAHKREECMEVYLHDLLLLDVPLKVKRRVARRILSNTMYNVSVNQRTNHHNNWLIYHYNLKYQNYPWSKQLVNIWSVMKSYHRMMASYNPGCYFISFAVAGITVLRMLRLYLRELKNPPTENPFIPGVSKL